jgi:alkylhydroperoxidase family enzyme
VTDNTQPPDAAPSALERAGVTDQLDPHLAPFFETWLDTFIFHGRIDARLRELAILRIMWRCGQAFEWGNHYRLARNTGVTREEVLAIRTRTPGQDLDGPVAVVVRAADEVVDGVAVTEETMSALRAVFPERGLLDEFLYLLGGYRMFATASASRREAYAGSHAPWPPDGVGPTGARQEAGDPQP